MEKNKVPQLKLRHVPLGKLPICTCYIGEVLWILKMSYSKYFIIKYELIRYRHRLDMRTRSQMASILVKGFKLNGRAGAPAGIFGKRVSRTRCGESPQPRHPWKRLLVTVDNADLHGESWVSLCIWLNYMYIFVMYQVRKNYFLNLLHIFRFKWKAQGELHRAHTRTFHTIIYDLNIQIIKMYSLKPV